MRRSKTGFTLIELLVVIAIIAVLAAMLLPALSKARDQARQATCASNLRQIGIMTKLYIDENEEFLPPWRYDAGGNTYFWFYLLLPYLGNKDNFYGGVVKVKTDIYNCASAVKTTGEDPLLGYSSWVGIPRIAYGENTATSFTPGPKAGFPQSLIRKPHNWALIMDGRSIYLQSDSDFFGSTSDNAPAYRHNNRANVLFLDGHVESSTPLIGERGHKYNWTVTGMAGVTNPEPY